MIRITPIQAKILETIIYNQKSRDDETLGLSLYDLRKFGVAGRSFEINRDFLLQYRLIKIIREEKTGLQTRVYYDITSIGFLALIKWTDAKEIQKLFKTKVAKRFLPLIDKHWDKLSNVYQMHLSIVLKKSVDQIEIVPPNRQIPTSSNSFHKLLGSLIEEVMTLPFEMQQMKISFQRKYSTLSKYELSQFETINKELLINNIDQMDIDITKRLAFVFYFNLLRVQMDIFPNMNIAYQIWKHEHQTKKESIEKNSRAKKAINEISNFSIEDLEIFEKRSDAIMTLIEKDPELLNVFKETLTEIRKKFSAGETKAIVLPPSLDSVMTKFEIS